MLYHSAEFQVVFVLKLTKEMQASPLVPHHGANGITRYHIKESITGTCPHAT